MDFNQSICHTKVVHFSSCLRMRSASQSLVFFACMSCMGATLTIFLHLLIPLGPHILQEWMIHTKDACGWSNHNSPHITCNLNIIRIDSLFTINGKPCHSRHKRTSHVIGSHHILNFIVALLIGLIRQRSPIDFIGVYLISWFLINPSFSLLILWLSFHRLFFFTKVFFFYLFLTQSLLSLTTQSFLDIAQFCLHLVIRI